jgi:hypothetical protein
LLPNLKMVTPLERPLRRAIEIDGKPYVATFRADGVTVVAKGRRKGIEITWKQILDGEIQLHAQLARSLTRPQPSDSATELPTPAGEAAKRGRR